MDTTFPLDPDDPYDDDDRDDDQAGGGDRGRNASPRRSDAGHALDPAGDQVGAPIELYPSSQCPPRPARCPGGGTNPDVRLASTQDAADWRSVPDPHLTLRCTPIFEAPRSNGARLSADPWGGVPLEEDAHRRNLLVAGGIGAGKTYRVALPMIDALLHQTGDSVVALSPKGPTGTEQIRELAHRHRPGEPVIVFSPERAARSVRCNPLAVARRRGRTEELVHALVGAVPTGRESGFWAAQAERIFRALIDIPTIKGLDELHAILGSSEALVATAKASGSEELREFAQFVAGGSHNAATSLADMAGRVARFATDADVRETTCTADDFDPFTQLESGERFTLVIEADENSWDRTRASINLFLTLLFVAMPEVAAHGPAGRLPRPVSCVLDEFGNVGRIPRFERLANTLRSRGVSVCALVQSLSQITSLYREDATTVLGGFSSQVYLASGLAATDRAWASGQTGAIRVVDWVEHQLWDPETGEWRPHARAQSFGQRPLLTPDDFRLPIHPIFGPVAVAFFVDRPPMLLHFTAAWDLPHMAEAMERAAAGEAERAAAARRERAARAGLATQPTAGEAGSASDSPSGASEPSAAPGETETRPAKAAKPAKRRSRRPEASQGTAKPSRDLFDPPPPSGRSRTRRPRPEPPEDDAPF